MSKHLRLTQDQYDAIVRRDMTVSSESGISAAAGALPTPWGYLPGREPASKYNNNPTVRDGIRFDSEREANRYSELKLLAHGGQIFDLRWHTRWPLSVRGSLQEDVIGHYESDFDYFPLGQDVRTIEDVKGMDTALSKWKRKHFQAQYGIPVAVLKKARRATS